jgi:hypothetical protein
MNPSNLTVRRTPLTKSKAAEGAATLDKICTAGAQCPAVQADPLAKQALAVLQAKTGTLHTSLSSKQQLAQAIMTAIKVLGIDLGAAAESLVNYEDAVRTLAAGDGSIINAAGLLSRVVKPPPPTLSVVENLASRKGAEASQAVLYWPAAPGATSYAVQVNFTPQTPAGPFTALGSGTRRTRLVKAPTPGAQFLAQVAAIASDGTQSAWSDAILATAR